MPSTGSPLDTRRSSPDMYASITCSYRWSENSSVTFTFTPRAVSSSMAGSPASVAGTLIITLGRSSRPHRSSACAIVPSVSSARSGVHSNDTKPSPPSVSSYAPRSRPAAARMSSRPSVKNSSWGPRTPRECASRSWSSYASEPVIAFAKIVGFEAAPVTPRSISRWKSPPSSRSRDSVSSQIDTPALRSSCRRFIRPSPSSFLCRCGHELLERDVRIRQPAHVHGLVGADHLLDRFGHVPDVHVHPGEYPAPLHPERYELPGGEIAPEDHLVPFRGVAAVLHSDVVLVREEVGHAVVRGLVAEHRAGRGGPLVERVCPVLDADVAVEERVLRVGHVASRENAGRARAQALVHH